MMCLSVRRPQKLNFKFFCSLASVLKHLLHSLIPEHYHYHHHQGETYFDSFGLPRTVLCQTTGKLVLLAKFWVTAIWQKEGMKMWGNFQKIPLCQCWGQRATCLQAQRWFLQGAGCTPLVRTWDSQFIEGQDLSCTFLKMISLQNLKWMRYQIVYRWCWWAKWSMKAYHLW